MNSAQGVLPLLLLLLLLHWHRRYRCCCYCCCCCCCSSCFCCCLPCLGNGVEHFYLPYVSARMLRVDHIRQVRLSRGMFWEI
uniref:Putative secreted protein n=1 Tax=Anopheles marajoara TaxID=58244 RepID=A0A2M4CBD1_9DIPT